MRFAYYVHALMLNGQLAAGHLLSYHRICQLTSLLDQPTVLNITLNGEQTLGTFSHKPQEFIYLTILTLVATFFNHQTYQFLVTQFRVKTS